MKREFVYVMFSNDTNLYKIGKSDNPFRRVVDLSCLLKEDITVVACAAVKDARKTESFLHHKFKIFAVNGEWFRFDDESFIVTFWEACVNNLEYSGYYTSPTHIASVEDKSFESFVNNHHIISARYAYSLFKDKYPGSATIPMKLKNLGCVKVNIKGISHYVTRSGQELNLHTKCDYSYRSKLIDVGLQKED